MSSTQHQLIEQCATRLRGIVEALDNIHDTSQHRWSTDLDDVHSSAESLLAMIKCQTADQAAQVLASPPPKCATCGGAGMVDDGEITCSEGGIPYENGPVKCVKDCPSCKAHPSPTQPEDAPVIGCLCGMPMTEGHHSPGGCCNLEEFAPQAQAEQAEAERPEVVAWRYGFSGGIVSDKACLDEWKSGGEYQSLMTVAQHERIVGALRFERQQMDRAFTACINERDAADARLHEVATACATAEEERDAALARVAELEMLLRELNTSGLMQFSTADEEKAVRAALSGAQAQHSAGYAEARMCANCRHIGINDAADYAACHDCNWTGPEPDEDKCPGCAGENCMAAACPECGGRYDLVAEANITAPAGQVPQAWLDVQAERRRQITAEGWTPEHDDEHDSGEIACAAACYALPPAHPARIEGALGRYGRDPNIWPWTRDWWKPAPNDRRRELIKAGALVLAEIERLDRAAASQGGPSDA
ncbi:TPA: hypothetical protein SL248_003407 [Pseudomonas aeruginosa]|nr:hypothetical protein [Pseudomonas aeruginosa]HEJ2419628.1 hypothetical protein [Pseudomonas aeruginosa]HEJ2531944.1 hypothetical protein [Pseudomonas aeruginosa]HEJ3001370.1 hypothetical protein [Pseudomonas aeruginosa]